MRLRCRTIPSPLARELLVLMRTGPGPDGSWYVPDLAHVVGADTAHVDRALAALERAGLVTGGCDHAALPGRCVSVYRATDAGRALALRIRAREQRRT